MDDYPIEGIRSVLSGITDKGIDITKPLLTTFDGQVPTVMSDCIKKYSLE